MVTTMGWSLEWYPRTKTLCRSKHRYITQELYIPRISQHFASLHWQWCLYINEILSNRTLHDIYGHVINILISTKTREITFVFVYIRCIPSSLYNVMLFQMSGIIGNKNFIFVMSIGILFHKSLTNHTDHPLRFVSFCLIACQKKKFCTIHVH